MVSVINKHWLKSNFPNEKIFLSEEFLGTPLNLKTANNTKLNIESVAVLDFPLKLASEKVKIPFTSRNHDRNIAKVADASDLLGEVRVPKRTMVPGNSKLRLKCRGNIEFDSKQKSVLFQPLLEPNISDILNINESYENLSKG